MMQTTISREITFTGPAIHTGSVSTVRLCPAPVHTGIVFRRVDLPGTPTVRACASRVVRTERCTTIGNGAAQISTVEHLLASFRGMGIDNAFVDIDGPEVPIADGSATLFSEMIQHAGLTAQGAPRAVTTVAEPVWVRDGDKVMVALPADELKVSFTFTNDHEHPALADFYAEFSVEPHTFVKEIAPARTIGWLSELEALQSRGLALGAQMDMAIVLGEDRVLSELRFPDEPVRHKILDVIGDLFLVGYLHAHVIAVKSGHALNNRLARAIMTQAGVTAR